MSHADIIPGIKRFAMRPFDHLSLRQRFLVAPLLGLVLMAVLTAAFVYEARRQNELLARLNDQHLAQFNQHAAVLSELTKHHLHLYDLLNRAPTMDGAALYDETKIHLYMIHEAVGRLEQALKHEAESRPAMQGLHEDIHALSATYLDEVASAVAMTTVDVKLAPEQLALASISFNAMSQAFVKMLAAEQAAIDEEVSARIEDSRSYAAAVAFAGIAVAAGLFLMALGLSLLLSRSLQAQVGTLTELGRQAGASMAVAGRTEMDRIAHAVGAFRQSLEELRRARDELELRVQERTRELEAANEELRSEVERRSAAEERLRIYGEVIRSTGEAVAITDADGRIVEINPAYQRATGRARDDVIGQPLHVAGRDPHPEEFYRALWRELKQNGYWTGEILERRQDGEPFPTWALINAVRDADGKLRHYACISRDITALKQSERELKRLAFYDNLTGLPNRALYNDRLNVALAGAQRDQSTSAVMFIDLDRFKYVNDTLGHAAGDQLLIEIGKRISRCLRSADTLARMGGDEFTVLLNRVESKAAAVRIAERIIDAVRQPVQLGDETVYVGASVGISVYPDDGGDAETLQKYADMAMYEAKEAGRGQWRVFDPEMLARGSARLTLSTQLEKALADDEFSLVYQPILAYDDNSLRGVEAFIRWHRSDGANLPPAVFLPHAEEAGLIKKIDCWVLARACRDAIEWLDDDGQPLSVSVNVSAISIQQPDMAGLIKDTLHRTGFPPTQLNLDITEASVRSNPNTVQAVLEELTSIGIRISVNDFGVSYASLNYLSQFPINCVKLTQHFVDRVGSDKTSEEIMQALLHLAERLDLTVVANGVERAEQMSFLRDAGCRLMQGHGFARPMTREDIASWVASRRMWEKALPGAVAS